MLNKEWLKMARILLKMTQQEVANQMCTTKQTICNIEIGESFNKMTMKFYEVTLKNNIEKNPDKELIEKILSYLESTKKS